MKLFFPLHQRSNGFKTYLNAYLPPILWASFIFTLSAQSTLPGPKIGWLDFAFKQSAHFFVYGVLHFLLYRGFNITLSKKNQASTWWLAILIAALYAITDEVHQSFIPLRSPNFMDIGFDWAGIGLSHYLTHRQKSIDSDVTAQ